MLERAASQHATSYGFLSDVQMQVAVDVDAIKWSLVHDRRPFFSASLSGLNLAMTRNDDNSGVLLLPLLATPPGPGLPAGDRLLAIDSG